nr:phenylalanine--tRNA ligase subunit beta [Flavisolibacter sp.]
DLDQVKEHKIIVKTADEHAVFFTTLDKTERKLHNEDLMICDANAPLCIAGVFGGLHSGVTSSTKNIFLESAWFDPVFIRKTSFRHGLRTDAATRFEKGTDISKTVDVLKRAALLIKEIAGGKIASDIVDVYPAPAPKKQVQVQYDYLENISGKNYSPEVVKRILSGLGFEIVNEDAGGLTLAVPFHKPDVSIPADIAEEILRIDGLDNIPIPATISIAPSVEANQKEALMKEKLSQMLTGLGFTEMLTNSITNSAYYTEETLATSVKLLNNLSSELDVLRPSMLHTALEVLAFNLNRKNNRLKFFEFGKTYQTSGPGVYTESNHLCLYITGNLNDVQWNQPAKTADLYYVKGIGSALLENTGIKNVVFENAEHNIFHEGLVASSGKQPVMELGSVDPALLQKFDIRQNVYFLDLYWDAILPLTGERVQYKEIGKYPRVERDLAIAVSKSTKYIQIREQLHKLQLHKLREVKLFDVFESEKLGADKKSMAINLTFMDEEKTLTDKEIDTWMKKIMTTLEKELQAEIRK